MYLLLTPGAIVQIDERRKRIVRGGPCTTNSKGPSTSSKRAPSLRVAGVQLKTAIWSCNHTPFSPEPMRVGPLKDVEVMGQVVAVAMRLLPSVPLLTSNNSSLRSGT
jgi:hypothetical protein